MVYQNWQIWGILLGLVVPLAMSTFQNGPNETFQNRPDELISMISEIGHCLLTCTSSILNVPLSSSQVIFLHRFASDNSPLWIGRHQVSRRKKMARWFNFKTNLYNRENIFSQISQNLRIWFYTNNYAIYFIVFAVFATCVTFCIRKYTSITPRWISYLCLYLLLKV